MKVQRFQHWWHVLVALCAVLLSWGAHAQDQASPVVRFDQAQVAYATSAEPGSPGTTPDLTWQAVRLPDSWVRHSPARQGVAYYRLVFDALPVWSAQERLMVYVPRAGNRFSVQLNGQWLGSTGDLSERCEDHVNVPHQFLLPVGALQPQANVLLLEVHGELARYAGLSEVWLGPASLIKPMHASRMAWQNGGALVIVGLALIIGVLALGFGLVMGAYVQVLFAWAAIFWGVRNCYVLVTVPPLPHPTWGILMDLLYGLAIVLLAYSVLLTLRAKNRMSLVVLGGMVLSTLTLPVVYGLTGAFAFRQYWLLSLVLGVLLVVSTVVWHWWRVRNFESNVLMVCALLALGLTLYDHLVILHLPSGYGHFAMARFAFLFILLAMSALLMRRVLRSINAARRFRTRLQMRLTRARALLSGFHEEREKKRVQEAELAERMRLLREMHDGVGAHLVTLHSMLQNPQSSRSDLQNELEQAGMALRDSLGALHDGPQTWLMVLVRLRESLESRLRHAGIGLSWQVDDLGEMPLPDVDVQRHFRMLLGECITNVIKHSGATQVTLQACRTDAEGAPGWVVRVCDNGHGLAASKGSGYGMANMLAHTRSMLAQLRIRPLQPGTCVEIGFHSL